MTAFLDPTRERFLRATTTKVAPERIAEAYLFSPIRQGGVESGVAVSPRSRGSTADAT